MNNVTQQMETAITAFAGSLYFMNTEATDIVKAYFATTATTLISGLSTGSTPATVQTGFNKTQYLAGITLLQNLQNFFGNASVTTSDYLGTCETLINGSNFATTQLSNDVESIGLRMKAVSHNLIQLEKDGTNINKIYSASGLSGILGSIASSTIVYGSSTTQSKFIGGIVLVQQLLNFLGNSAVTTGDYYTTVANWVQGS